MLEFCPVCKNKIVNNPTSIKCIDLYEYHRYYINGSNQETILFDDIIIIKLTTRVKVMIGNHFDEETHPVRVFYFKLDMFEKLADKKFLKKVLALL